jgi:hypothetical protein
MITLQGADDPYSLSGLQFARYQQWVVLNLDTWDQLISRQHDGLIQDESIIGWNEYFTLWTKRHVTRALWSDIAWNWPGTPTGGGIRDRVEAALADEVRE